MTTTSRPTSGPTGATLISAIDRAVSRAGAPVVLMLDVADVLTVDPWTTIFGDGRLADRFGVARDAVAAAAASWRPGATCGDPDLSPLCQVLGTSPDELSGAVAAIADDTVVDLPARSRIVDLVEVYRAIGLIVGVGAVVDTTPLWWRYQQRWLELDRLADDELTVVSYEHGSARDCGLYRAAGAVVTARHGGAPVVTVAGAADARARARAGALGWDCVPAG